ncbi:MAG TPA: ATP-binding protein [Thermomicrobiales bacterium]|nr:ATP-binding protein [Thermomicrobiales bacterium]
MNSNDVAPADLRLAESEQRYQAVIENASDMIQSVRADGSFEFVNKAWRDSLGYDDDDLATLNIWHLIHPDAMDHCQIAFARAMQGEPIDDLRTTFVAKDGRAVPIEGSVTSRMIGDEVVATHGFFRDITERIRTQELEERAAHLEREERARYLEKMAALGKLSAGLAHELNNPAAAVQRANAGLDETLRSRDAAILALATAGISPESWRVLDEIRDRAGKGTRPDDPIALSDVEAELEDWLGDAEIDRAWEIAPSLAEAGVVVDDLEAISAAVPVESLSPAIDCLAATVSLHESLSIIRESSRRISDLVSAIKGYTHMDRATEHSGDIHDGLENTLVILNHRLQNIEVSRSYDRSIPPILMYGNVLNQVWTNIIDNAIDAMNGEGRITIRTRHADGCAFVEIEDSGCGIPEDVLPRIFEPFYTSKPQGKGTGLGLDTAWRIVTEEHQGSIWANSAPGQTVFTVRLPITSDEECETA